MRGMASRGYIPVANGGRGDCVFISLAQIVLGDPAKFAFIRYMIMQRIKSFPKKYHKSNEYCENMAVKGTAATMLECQVIADICFSVVECYSTDDFYTPKKIIWPLRIG